MDLTDLAFWRNISIIFLAVETAVLLTIPLVILYFAVRGLNFVHMRLPRVLFRAQDISKAVRTKTESISERVADPLVRAERERTRAATTVTTLLTPDSSTSSARKRETTREP